MQVLLPTRLPLPMYDEHFGEPSISYASISDLLSDSPELESPAMIHGWATGVLCAGFRPDHDRWVEQLYEFSKAEALQHWQVEPLLEIFDTSLQTLQSTDFAFQLLLPDEEENLFEDCLDAFSQWCQGFMHGFATLQQELSEEAEEILKDLTEISQIDCSSVESDENDGYFIELEEFVRMATMSLFMEYAPEASKQSEQEEPNVH